MILKRGGIGGGGGERLRWVLQKLYIEEVLSRCLIIDLLGSPAVPIMGAMGMGEIDAQLEPWRSVVFVLM